MLNKLPAQVNVLSVWIGLQPVAAPVFGGMPSLGRCVHHGSHFLQSASLVMKQLVQSWSCGAPPAPPG